MPRDRVDRMESEAARRFLHELLDSTDKVSDALLQHYRPGGAELSTYDEGFAVARKAALEREVDRLEGQLNAEAQDTVRRTARAAQVFMSDAAGFPVVVDARVVDYSMSHAADEVRGVTDAIRSALRRAVTRAVAGATTHSEFVAEVREALGGEATRARVERIARNEVNLAYQQQRAAMDGQLARSGSDLVRRWVSQLDDRVRDTHLAIHGQERELWQPFNVGLSATDDTPPSSKAGYKANGPLDPTLPPEEAINCRCDVLYVDRAQATKDYIRKSSKPRARLRASAETAPPRVLPAPSADRLRGLPTA